MINLLKEYSFLAPYGTSIGVIIAMIQLWRSASQGKTNFEDSISKEYRDIIRRIPCYAMLGLEVSESQKSDALDQIYNYMDLCNEQIFLRMKGRVRGSTWNDWQEGMKINFDLPLFREASDLIFEQLPNAFQELRRVKSSGFQTDPRMWKRGCLLLNWKRNCGD